MVYKHFLAVFFFNFPSFMSFSATLVNQLNLFWSSFQSNREEKSKFPRYDHSYIPRTTINLIKFEENNKVFLQREEREKSHRIKISWQSKFKKNPSLILFSIKRVSRRYFNCLLRLILQCNFRVTSKLCY